MEPSSKLTTVKVLAVLVAAVLVLFAAKEALAYFYVRQGINYLKSGSFSSAEKSLRYAKIFQPRNPEIFAYLGKSQLGRFSSEQDNPYPAANFEKVIEFDDKALSLGLQGKNSGLYAQILEDTGFAYWNLKQHGKANDKFLEKIASYPEISFWPRYFVALNYFHRFDKPKEALEILLPALDSTNAEPLFLYRVYELIASLYAYFDDYEKVDEFAKLAIRGGHGMRDRYVQSSHILRAIAAAKRGDFSLARSEIEEANDVGNPFYVTNCASARVEFINRNFPQAISLIEKTLQLAGKTDRRYLLCMEVAGESYLALGNKTKTREYFLRYLNESENIEDQNVFIVRNRKNLQSQLQKL